MWQKGLRDSFHFLQFLAPLACWYSWGDSPGFIPAPHLADHKEGAMPDLDRRGDSSTVASGRSHRRPGTRCLPRERFGLARVVCVVGLFVLLVSAISPLDDSVQPDFARHSSSLHRTVTVSKPGGAIHLTRRHCALTSIECGAYAAPVLHSAPYAVPASHACSSSPGFERTHTGRAPPPSLLTA